MTPPPILIRRRTKTAEFELQINICRCILALFLIVLWWYWKDDSLNVPGWYVHIYYPYSSKNPLTEAWIATFSFLFAIIFWQAARKIRYIRKRWEMHWVPGSDETSSNNTNSSRVGEKKQIRPTLTWEEANHVANYVDGKKGKSQEEYRNPQNPYSSASTVQEARREECKDYILLRKSIEFYCLGSRYYAQKLLNFYGKHGVCFVFLSVVKGLEAIIGYMLGILVFHQFRERPPLTQVGPEFWRVVIELVFRIFSYDFIFFWIHLLILHKARFTGNMIIGRARLGSGRFNKNRGWFSFFDNGGVSIPYPRFGIRLTNGLSSAHVKHHSAPPGRLRPADTVFHSLIDGGFQVGTNILVQNLSLYIPFTNIGFGKKHDLTRILHNILITFILVESHSGLDAPFSLHNMFSWSDPVRTGNASKQVQFGLSKRDDDKTDNAELNDDENTADLGFFYGGAARHEEHHGTWITTSSFQQFFTYLDAMIYVEQA